MTDDIVTRLREGEKWHRNGYIEVQSGFYDFLADEIERERKEAADEIENLRKAIWEIAELARKHYKSGILWGAINHAVDVADEHYKNCDCGERY